MDKDFTFLTDCIGSDANSIQDMVESARQITYATLLRHVDVADLESLFPGYDWRPGPNATLRMKNDWAVSFWRSTYQGLPCYYINWSAIEFIFVRGEDLNRRARGGVSAPRNALVSQLSIS